ncbi:MAG TPA: hypothetical protein VFX85_00955 [Solirubrobacterales bacterium]|nr:hypothetical protein [Solirubrobacterales bacterium]
MDRQGSTNAGTDLLDADVTQHEGNGAGEDPRPDALRPQEIPTAKMEPVSPRVREQALPEKDDDRFFDRWVVDKARGLGARAVKRGELEKLREATGGFAKWRSMRHKPAAAQATIEDRALVAATGETIKEARAKAERLSREAEIAVAKEKVCAAETETLKKERSALPPALRGLKLDMGWLAGANVVIFAVDIFIIHLALGRIPGNPRDYWLTAITMGAGAVVIGDVLGWIGAAGAVRKDGRIGRPGRPAIFAVAAILALAVWFFIELGEFRAEALIKIEDRTGVELGDPTFFTIAQILFLLGAAASSFSYVARSHGRDLLARHITAEQQRKTHDGDAIRLRGQAEQAHATAVAAPRRRDEANERIKARERIAEEQAKRDVQQGAYLEALIDPEYARERADVESGVRFWQLQAWSGGGEMPTPLRWALGVVATLLGGGIAYAVTVSLPGAVVIAVIVAGAYALMTARGGAEDEDAEARERERHQRYIAKLLTEVRYGDERATDIERLEPFPPTPPASAARHPEEGNGASEGQAAHDAYKKLRAEEESIAGDV